MSENKRLKTIVRRRHSAGHILTKAKAAQPAAHGKCRHGKRPPLLFYSRRKLRDFWRFHAEMCSSKSQLNIISRLELTIRRCNPAASANPSLSE
jgi:hypothetical protein